MFAQLATAIGLPRSKIFNIVPCVRLVDFNCDDPTTTTGSPTKSIVHPAFTTQDPQVITPQPTSPPPVITPQTAPSPSPPLPLPLPPQETNVLSVPDPKNEGRPTPETKQRPENVITTSRAPNSVLPPTSPLSLTSSFEATQQLATSTTSSSSSNIVQSSTAAVIPPSAPEDQPTSHHGADPRIIIPVVLGVVALAVGFAIFWAKKIKKRQAYAQEEMSEWAHGAGHGSFENRSEERLNAVPMASEWKEERGVTALTQRMDAIEQAIKARVGGRKTKGDLDSKTEKLGGQDAGYGWGLGARDDKLHGHS